MTKIDNGGTAFPKRLTASPGMTLRDYFAGQALAGIMANPERWKDIAARYEAGEMTYDDASRSNAVKAYNIADAMLRVRSGETEIKS